MNGNRCVWLCGGSWRFGPMWHFYCLGDLGQWSTSGTSHNRVHMSTAIRHPTRQAERERAREREARAKKHLGSLFPSRTHTHTNGYAFGILCFLRLLGFLQVHLDSDGERKGGLRVNLTDSLEPECSLYRVSNSPIESCSFVFCFF